MEFLPIIFNNLIQFSSLIAPAVFVIGTIALLLFIVFIPKKIDKKLAEIDFGLMSSFLKK